MPDEKYEMEYEAQEGSSMEHEDRHLKRHSATPEASENPFYQPNPDLLRDDLDEDLKDDDMLLAEGSDDYIAPPKQVHAGVLIIVEIVPKPRSFQVRIIIPIIWHASR
ncbi:hypothetical protein CJJ09_001928 [Candidozyma auris]|nr:hypothetical protein CJJ09_001928 [[Candida] auris]